MESQENIPQPDQLAQLLAQVEALSSQVSVLAKDNESLALDNARLAQDIAQVKRDADVQINKLKRNVTSSSSRSN